MPVINVTMDVAGVDTASNRLSANLGAISDRIKEITSVQNTFNKAGVQVGSTIRGLTKDGQDFTATLGVLNTKTKDIANATSSLALGLKNIKFGEKKKEIEELTDKSSSLKAGMDRLARSFQYFVTYKAFNFITSGLENGITAAKDLQIEISKIRTITQGKDQQSFAKTGKDIRETSDSLGINIGDVSKAFYDTTSNQVAKGSGVAAFVKQAGELARVTGSTTADAVNLLSSRINAYGLSAADADKVSAQFFKTIDEGRVVASEMANTIGRVDVVASNLGITMEEVNATIAITTQKGFTTADSMTLLTNLMSKLEKPTESTAAFFKSIGAESGEAAIKIAGGLVPLMRLIVEQTKSGILPVSAFFDEIRGRKQFGVFEQSIDQIDNFQKKLKDTKSAMEEYREAVKLRGESPADALVKEFNKLDNIFKVNFGQAILKGTADLAAYLDVADKATKNVDMLGGALKLGSAALLGYGAILGGITIYNNIAAVSFLRLGQAANIARIYLLPFLAGYAIGQKLMNRGDENMFGNIDPNAINSAADAVERWNKANEKRIAQERAFKAAQASGPTFDFDAQIDKVGAAYTDIQKLIGNAVVANGNLLDQTKSKSKEVAETLKLSFSSWSDTLKQKISDFKKAATEAAHEIDKSLKTTEKYKDTLDKILLDTKLAYANDDLDKQKINLLTNEGNRLQGKADEAFKSGDPIQVEEARRLYDEIARIRQQAFQAQVELNKKQFEQGLNANPGLRNPNGPDLFLVDTLPLEKELNFLREKRNASEKEYIRLQQTKEKTAKGAGKAEEDNLKKLTQAFDSYSKISLTNKDGGISSDFKDKTGKFDKDKLDAMLDAQEKKIRETAGGTYQERFELEKQFMAQRRALYAEAGAIQRSEDLKTIQTRTLNEESAQKQKVEKQKKERDELLKEQERLTADLGNLPVIAQGFKNKLGEAGQFKGAYQDRVNEAGLELETRIKEALNKPINKDGLSILDPELVRRVNDQWKIYLNTVQNVREAAQGGTFGANKIPFEVKDANGRAVTLGEAKGYGDQLQSDINKNGNGLFNNITTSQAQADAFELTVVKPFERLKGAFPELQKSAADFTTGTAAKFQDLSTSPGLNSLIEKLKEVERLMKAANKPDGKVSFIGGDGGGMDAAYAATGGVVGQFPGQPRGVDKYPIWAANGEVIINAQSAAQYKPQLQAIQDRRLPRYMAAGGIVGGDTNVGDINVTVNGGNTGADTARIIGTRLEREIRRGVINLNGKRK